METVPPGIPTKNTAKCKNLAGQRFGKLVVLSPTEKRMDNGSIASATAATRRRFPHDG